MMASRFEDPEIAMPGLVNWEPVKVAEPTLKASSTRRIMVMPRSLDLNGDGVISESEAKAAGKQINILRWGVCTVLVVLGVQQLLMFGTVYWAMQLAAEVHVGNTELRDDNGNQVSTLQRRDRIDGLHYTNTSRRLSVATRRLNLTESDANGFAGNATASNTGDFDNVTFPGNQTANGASDSRNSTNDTSVTSSRDGDDVIGFHGTMEIPQDYFQSTWTGYMSGKSDWVVPFPDGSVRTVFIQGMGADYAWGLCGACPGGNVQWQATCPADGAEECSVVYEQVLRRRRLAETEDGGSQGVTAATTPLLARARAQTGVDAEPGLERSLGGKHCV
jgi:hypothetical protein